MTKEPIRLCTPAERELHRVRVEVDAAEYLLRQKLPPGVEIDSTAAGRLVVAFRALMAALESQDQPGRD